MENSMSRILIETVVRKTLKDMKEDPERGIRNLVDMALHFSNGRFQTNFFQVAQTMLKNENSPYYALLRNISSSVDAERLVTFGMNLGYNSCTLRQKNPGKRTGTWMQHSLDPSLSDRQRLLPVL